MVTRNAQTSYTSPMWCHGINIVGVIECQRRSNELEVCSCFLLYWVCFVLFGTDGCTVLLALLALLCCLSPVHVL